MVTKVTGSHVLRFFLLEHLKSLVYETRLRTIDVLKDNIRNATADMTPQSLERVRYSVQYHIIACAGNRRGHSLTIFFFSAYTHHSVYSVRLYTFKASVP